MLDTCFFFLVSDYIVADGSLANALQRIYRGTSAVVVGNLQVTRETALPWLQEKLAHNENTLALPPRELMRWALNNLHPVTLANVVNIPFSHNLQTNRLFWRVDSNTMLGRFYLMHMLCVRPEVADFVVGSSCDYSFVPEMCPSANVEVITDSDEYLVIEMQPRSHEARAVRSGPIEIRTLAKSLSEWTTVTHRENANSSLLFHADELPSDVGRSIEQADAFIADVARKFTREPWPHRGHPYWIGAMAAFREASGQKLNDEEWSYALDLSEAPSKLTNWMLWHSKFSLLGRPPRVLPWHPAWPDFRTVLREINTFFIEPDQRMLMLSNEPTPFSVALASSGERVNRLRCHPFLKNPSERYARLHGQFDLCLIEIDEQYMEDGGELTDRIVPLMKNGGRIILFVLNRRIVDKVGEFGEHVALQSSRFIRSSVVPTQIHYVPSNLARRLGRRGMSKLRRLMNKGVWITAPLTLFGAGIVLLLSFIGNLDSWRATRRTAGRGHVSSFVMRLAVDASMPAPSQTHPQSESANGSHTALRLEATKETQEPQYNRCLELRDTIGLASLGLMTNQVWYDDPRRLTFLLARYKFVAKMLTGCRNVGEVGCGDAFGSRVVLQAVSDVTVYDFDSLFIEDIRARNDEKWPLNAEIHDIVAAPLPRKHDALFSLDVIEHISRENEHAYLAHLCESLTENGLLMIGTPSLESQAYASPPSKAGHINCKSGNELNALLENYFEHVFMFSMNDEVVHTGFSQMAHYLFALCSGPKWQKRNISRQGTDEPRQFAICETASGDGFFVSVTYPNREPRRMEGFKSVAEAARWIGDHALDGTRDGHPAS
jgi:2-polyprenyl-3-methyl-5-hydroxy-6-metoxy-1,4-benzoquinol methylase